MFCPHCQTHVSDQETEIFETLSDDQTAALQIAVHIPCYDIEHARLVARLALKAQ